MSEAVTITGAAPNALANAISDALHAAINGGMPTDEAVCVAVGVCADYARADYGDGYLTDLCTVVLYLRRMADAAAFAKQGAAIGEQISQESA